MDNQDTISLLKECESGTKMAVAAINEVLDKVSDPRLKNLLIESKDHHAKLGNDLHGLLLDNACGPQEPNPMAKGMSWFKTNMKMAINESDNTIADLITDGCDMGIKSLFKYRNQYKTASQEANDICSRLIKIEEELRKDLRCYL